MAKIPRPQLSSARFALLLAIGLVLFYNTPFWTEVFRLRDALGLRDLGFLASLFLLLVLALNLALSLVAVKYLQKPIAILILTSAAVATYFTNSYGVLIDSTMIQNAMETDPREVWELLSGRLLLFVLSLGILPSLIVYRTRIRYRSWREELKIKTVTALLSAAAMALIAVLYYPDFVSLFSHNHRLRHLVTPGNYISGTVRYLRESWAKGPVIVQALGAEAKLGETVSAQDKNTLTILVVGETARAQQFSLNGYERDTNPYLSQEQVFDFDNVYACGTATAVSVRCMFSHLARRDYDSAEVRRHEGLLDVLAHAGVSVVWRDNNSGCKGVCARIQTQDPSLFRTPEFCNSSECFDEVLLNRLEEHLASVHGHVFVVLHQKGSHGPAYHLRSPARFKKFTPECTSNQLQDCTRQEILNAYDNSILYTDYFLGRVIEFLKERSDRYNTAMLYVSDHGESLGDRHLFLHGLPYFLAPEEQTRVPLIVWLSEGFKEAFAVDPQCLRDRRSEPLSHDNLFHSVLGLMDVDTEVYDEKLDIFANCRRPGLDLLVRAK